MTELTQANKASSQKPVLIVLIVLIATLAVASGFLTYMYFQNRGKLKAQAETIEEKQGAYDTLHVAYEKQIKIVTEVQTEVVYLREQNAMSEALAQQYLNELETLKDQLRTAQRARVPIDGSDTESIRAELQSKKDEIDLWKKKYEDALKDNEKLTSQVALISGELDDVQKENKNLSVEVSELSDKVEEAARIKAYKAEITGKKVKNNGDRVTESKAKKVDKLLVQVSLVANNLARQGERDIYFVVRGPDGKTLNESKDRMFDYKGNEVSYSNLETITYQNEDMEVTSEISGNGKFQEGSYEVEIFMEGELLKVASVNLK